PRARRPPRRSSHATLRCVHWHQLLKGLAAPDRLCRTIDMPPAGRCEIQALLHRRSEMRYGVRDDADRALRSPPGARSAESRLHFESSLECRSLFRRDEGRSYRVEYRHECCGGLQYREPLLLVPRTLGPWATPG